MEDIDDCVIVTRLVDSGEEAEDGGTLLKVRRISRPDGFGAIAEIRASLDLLEKELKEDEALEKKALEKTKPEASGSLSKSSRTS